MTNWPDNRLFGGGLEVTVSTSWAVFVGSAVDAAVMVTVPPEGIAGGAVNVVAAPLSVWTGEKDPQAPGLPQVTVQSTPRFPESLVTVAINLAVWLCTIVLLGTPWLILMETGAVIVTVVVAVTTDGPPVAEAVAVMVTTGLGFGLAAGTVGGAVKVAGAPLAV